MNKFDDVITEVKDLYPGLTDEEILKLINEALDQKPVKDLIVGYICNKKIKEKNQNVK